MELQLSHGYVVFAAAIGGPRYVALYKLVILASHECLA